MTAISNRQIAIFAGAGSAALLIAALAFQRAGYAPCELCILQRWPHLAAAIIAAVIASFGFRRWLAALGLIAALLAVAFAAYHAGVEWGFWQGPAHCSGSAGALTGLSTQEAFDLLQAAPVVRCDQAAWEFLSISMAGWNAICSAILAAFWAVASFRRP